MLSIQHDYQWIFSNMLIWPVWHDHLIMFFVFALYLDDHSALPSSITLTIFKRRYPFEKWQWVKIKKREIKNYIKGLILQNVSKEPFAASPFQLW